MDLLHTLLRKKPAAPKAQTSLCDLKPGMLLIDRYRLTEMVGQGSMGSVYRAEDQLLGGVTVAVKFLSQTLLSEKMAQQFAQEARAGALLGHQSLHIVRVLDYGLHEEQMPFYVMECIEGINLEQLLQVKSLSLARFLKLMGQVCSGLHCAHQGINVDGNLYQVIHRDIKPSNIFVTHNESLGELAKLLDFGIADFLNQTLKDGPTQPFMGTLAYGSPEQISGQQPDSRSDIYSLGVTMFESLTGDLPIKAEVDTFDLWHRAHCQQQPRRFSQADPHLEIPAPLEEVIMACLAKQPEQRPQNVEEIREVLRTVSQSGIAKLSQPTDTIPELVKIAAQIEQQQQSPAHQTLVTFESAEDVAWHSTWPENIPQAKIAFPQTLKCAQQDAAALWVMLAPEEIQQRMLNTRHCHFLCTFAPHPMLLWITSIFSREQGPKWMPCYIDLKDQQGRYMTQLLSSAGYYHLLMFGLQSPSRPANVATVSIPEPQRKHLSDWLTMAHGKTSTGTPAQSKQFLREKYQSVKAKIQSRL
ncbi:Serine/threonine-protein kinase A [Acaryochloris thomasi RCC1774]|uniref:Serine/threonine-protein kinase A n=1 Tax=Acaryochloris thomasi RCC1774 TaxID=1764569 RepID=A0A2W1JWG2_9CYAN|nr:serine/threonine-protein kinase [Acaryochloris thomasi]PZD72737.1 Serine/threonine-protein kinase A [Acaryochloris thomasi RCC1774]